METVLPSKFGPATTRVRWSQDAHVGLPSGSPEIGQSHFSDYFEPISLHLPSLENVAF